MVEVTGGPTVAVEIPTENLGRIAETVKNFS